MSEREIALLITDMLNSAKKILQYTGGLSFDDFLSDEKTIDAVVRNFEIIGEAASKIPPDFKSEYSQIEWKRIIGFRNRIIHDYFGIDYEILWNIKENNLPELIAQLETVLENLNQNLSSDS